MTESDAISQELAALRQIVESDHRARVAHAEQLGAVRRDMLRLSGWLTALTFDDRGAMVQDDAPPILRLLAALLDENRDLRAQNELIIAQNTRMIAGPPADLAGAVREVRLGVRLVAAGVVLSLVLLATHHWYLVARFSAALGWLVGGG